MYWDYNATVERNLINDWMQGVVPKVEALISNTTVLIYNGQLDVILGAPLCLNALAKLNWPGASNFSAAKKQVWKLPDATGTVAGYVIEAVSGDRSQGLTHAAVRLAGHMVSYLLFHQIVDFSFVLERFPLMLPTLAMISFADLLDELDLNKIEIIW